MQTEGDGVRLLTFLLVAVHPTSNAENKGGWGDKKNNCW
jgi:hypothetical protein